MPAFAELISDKDEGADPERRSAVGKQGEGTILELGRSSHDGSEVPHSGDEIAGHERPVADAIEPIVNALDVAVSYVQPAANSRVEKLPADGAADQIAAGDAGHASRQSAGESGNQAQMPLEYQEAAAGEQEFVGDGKS